MRIKYVNDRDSVINFKDSKMGLELPIPISEISDYDLRAPFVSESG